MSRLQERALIGEYVESVETLEAWAREGREHSRRRRDLAHRRRMARHRLGIVAVAAAPFVAAGVRAL